MNLHPRNQLRLAAATLAVTTLGGVLPVSAGASSNPSAASLIAATKADLAKQSSVHVVVTSTSGGTKSSVVVDIGTSNGVETITTGKESVTISLTPTYAYLTGSALGLTTMMGLTAAQQKRVGNKAISMAAGTTPYKNFKANLTFTILSTVLPSLTGTKLGRGTGANANNYVLSWSTKAVGTSPATKSSLTISSGKNNLPISEYITSSSGNGTTSFSNWGEHIKVPVPSSTITYTKALAK